MCMRRRKQPTNFSQLDTITHVNMGAIDTSTKFLTINSAYGSHNVATDRDDIGGITESTKIDDEDVQYEDVVEVRKAYREKKNEFELSENVCKRAEDVTESFYDNDEYEN